MCCPNIPPPLRGGFCLRVLSTGSVRLRRTPPVATFRRSFGAMFGAKRAVLHSRQHSGARSGRIRECMRPRRMLNLHKRPRASNTAHAKTVLQRDFDATDREIVRLVYELYNLTDDEIRTVEEATG